MGVSNWVPLRASDKGFQMSSENQASQNKHENPSKPLSVSPQEGTLDLAPWENWLLKIFPIHLLTPRHYIELGLISIAGALWMSFIHVRWWGVENAFVKTVFYSTSLHLILLVNAIRLNFVSGAERSNSFQDYKFWITPVLCGISFVALTFFGVGQEYRILADETNLLGSAMSLYLDQTYQNITEGTFYYDSFHTIESVIDKRPPLFSYLIAICHFLFGYRPYHGFLVNLAIAFASGAMFFYIGRKYLGSLFGLMVVVCYAAIPVVMIGMGSSGFEVMTALFNTIVVWRCVEFLKNPTSQQLELLLLCLLGAAQGRYESVILTLPVGLSIILRLKKIQWHPSALRLLLVPFLFIPLNWQKHITSSINGGDPEGTITFSVSYFWKHFVKFLNFWFDWQRLSYPSNLAITITSLIGVGLLVHRVLKKQNRDISLQWALLIGGMSAVAIILAQLCYYMGDVTEPAMQRFAIAYAPAVAFAAAYFFWQSYYWTRKSWILPGCLLIIFFLGMSIAGRNPLGKTLVLFREYKSMLAFVTQFPHQGTLIVAGRPGMFTVHGYGAISRETFENRAKEWKSNIERKLFTNVIIEEFIYYDQEKNPRQPLPPEFETETLYEYQNDAEYYVRFSRIHPKKDQTNEKKNAINSINIPFFSDDHLKIKHILDSNYSHQFPF